MCCGVKGRTMNMQRSGRTPARTARPVPAILPQEGMTMLTFLGPGSNTRPYYGAAPRFQRYLFGGKNHRVGNVYDSDVATLLAIKENGRPLFVKVAAEKVAKVSKPLTPVSTIPPVDTVVDNAPVEPSRPSIAQIYAMAAKAGVKPESLHMTGDNPTLSQVKRAIAAAKKKAGK